MLKIQLKIDFKQKFDLENKDYHYNNFILIIVPAIPTRKFVLKE